MRVVVTGGAGFIGSHLIEALAARRDEVVCVERPGAPRTWIGALPAEFRETGLDDAAALRRALEGADVVYHLAGLTHARSAADYYAVNTEGTARLLEAAAAHDGRAPRVVLASSLAAQGPCRNGEPLSSDSVPYPLSHYGVSKLLAEVAMHAYADRVPGVVLRFAAVYGPRERGVLNVFRLVRRGFALTVGSWERELSFLYVRDAVQACLAAGTREAAVGRTYCVAHPERATWAAFVRAAGHALGRDPVRLSLPAPLAHGIAAAAELGAALRRRAAVLNRERVREMAQDRWVCDPGPATRQLGFRPEYPLERGMAETAEWYREARWI